MDSTSIITQVSRDEEAVNINTHHLDHVQGECKNKNYNTLGLYVFKSLGNILCECCEEIAINSMYIVLLIVGAHEIKIVTDYV